MRIMIYGDGNSFGKTLDNKRMNIADTWPAILQKNLPEHTIINESLPGRITGSFDNLEKYKNGKEHFLAIYKSHEPIDMVIISLGSNDFHNKYKRSSLEIYNDLAWYKNTLMDHGNPRILYIFPILFIPDEDNYKPEALQVRDTLRNLINQNNLGMILDPGALSLLANGLNLDLEGHQKMAQLVYKVIMEV